MRHAIALSKIKTIIDIPILTSQRLSIISKDGSVIAWIPMCIFEVLEIIPLCKLIIAVILAPFPKKHQAIALTKTKTIIANSILTS